MSANDPRTDGNSDELPALAMSVDERREFLTEVRVAVFGVPDPRRPGASLLAPVWYAWEPSGLLVVQTGRDSLKARFARAAGRFSLCVQDESPPYRYVSVDGPLVTVTDPADPGRRTALAHRYLDSDEATAYLAATSAQLTGDITLWMRPEQWRTADFTAFARQFG